MGEKTSRLRYLAAVMLGAGTFWPTLPQALTVTIEAGDAPDRLLEFARTVDISVMYNYRQLSEFRTKAVAVESDWRAALHKMLVDTGLKVSFTRSRVAIIEPEDPAARTGLPSNAMPEVVVRPAARRAPPTVRRPIREPRGGDPCTCAYTIEATGVSRGPWCKHSDGRVEYVPERCPLP